ncbi:MAG TPA: hypothetical protein VLT13_13730, partial [Bacteroidota bacterium]|nr:hypothetical protein [Bacteroidota bacterium]
MTSRTLLATLLTLVPLIARAQDAADADPLARVRELASSNEVVMVWSQGPAVNLQQSTFKIYDVDLTREVDQALTSGPRMEDSLIGGRKGLTLATGNFTDGPLKHIAAAWVRPDSTIELIVPEIDGGTLSWTTANRLTIPVGDTRTDIRLVAGTFLGDFLDEFVLAYQGADGVIHLQLFSFATGSLLPQARGEKSDGQLMALNSGLNSWDLAAGDLNGDDRDEFVLASVRPRAGGWATVLSVYGANDGGAVIAHGSRDVAPDPAYQVFEINTALAIGDFDYDTVDEIAFAFCYFQGEETGPDTYVYLTNVSSDLSDIPDLGFPVLERDAVGPNEIEALAMAAGDVDADIREEFVLGIGGT